MKKPVIEIRAKVFLGPVRGCHNLNMTSGFRLVRTNLIINPVFDKGQKLHLNRLRQFSDLFKDEEVSAFYQPLPVLNCSGERPL